MRGRRLSTDLATSRPMVPPPCVISPAACTTLCRTSVLEGGSTDRGLSSRGGPVTASGRGFALVRGGAGFGAVAFRFACALGAACRVRAEPPLAAFDAPEVAALVLPAAVARGLAVARGFFVAPGFAAAAPPPGF